MIPAHKGEIKSWSVSEAIMLLSGDYHSHSGGATPVKISELSERDCRLCGRCDLLEPGSSGCLWIGAIGPIDGDVAQDADAGLRIRFATPLDPAIIAHFEAA